MSGREIRDMAASVKSRLLAIARQRGESFDLTLTTYARERLLYRMSHSPHKDRFVLKGATLFSIWCQPACNLDPPQASNIDPSAHA